MTESGPDVLGEGSAPSYVERANTTETEQQSSTARYRLPSITELPRQIASGEGIALAYGEGASATVIIHPPANRPKISLDRFAPVPEWTNLIQRPEVTEPIIDSLLSESGPVAITAIEGMGGIGKTVVANLICRDPRIQTRFRDGILWFSFGKQSGHKPADVIERLAHALDLTFAEYSLAAFQTMLDGKSALVVLDDIWSVDVLDSFLLNSETCRLLYTTRIRNISASVLGVRNHDVSRLTENQSRHFLAHWSGCEVTTLPEPHAGEIVKECEGLALGLSMIGAALKGKQQSDWARIARNLKRAHLKDTGTRLAGYGYKTLSASIAASLDELSTEDRKRYLKLAVLLEDMTAPAVILEQIWGDNQDEVESLMNRFVDLSLASREPNGSIRVHDLQLDYVRSEYPDPQLLALIHSALRRSLHVVLPYPARFASQMIARLLAYDTEPAVLPFIANLDANEPRPRLRLLRPTMEQAGGLNTRVLEGHLNSVFGVAVTDDGKRAISASRDKTLKVWDLDTGRVLQTLIGHSDFVRGVAVTVDGNRAVSASDDNTLKVWDLDTGQVLRTLEGHSYHVYGVVITPDGKHAISASGDKTLKVWDLDTGQVLRTLKGHSYHVYGVALTSDGKRAVSASLDKTLKVWDWNTGRILNTLKDNSISIRGVAVTPDGNRAISCSASNKLNVWDLDSCRIVKRLVGHSSSINCVAVTRDGKCAISGSDDNTLKVWDLETGEALQTLEGHSDSVRGVAVTQNGHLALSASSDGTLKVWDLNSGRANHPMEGHTSSINSLAVTKDGKKAVSASSDLTLKIWDLQTGGVIRTLQGHSKPVVDVVLIQWDKIALGLSANHKLKKWDIESGRLLKTWTLDSHRIRRIPRSRRGISISSGPNLYVVDLESGKLSLRLQGHSESVNDVAVTPDGKWAISASSDRNLKVWNLDTGGVLHTLRGHSDSVRAVAVIGDGKRAISASWDRTIKVWNIDTGDCLSTLEGLSAPINTVAIAPNGNWVVSASSDRTLKLWNLRTGLLVAGFSLDAPVRCCSFANEREIVVGDASGGFHFLRLDE
jgi:WD40 repeat protein